MLAPTPLVLSHWHKLIESLEASSQAFYDALQEAVAAHQMPEAKEPTRIEYREGGLGSAQRTYLRIQRGKLIFDVCGAPFGTGFFVSWWMGELRRGIGPLLLLMGGGLLGLGLLVRLFGFWGFLLFLILIPAVFWALANLLPPEYQGWDDPIVALPMVGAWYEMLFRPQTYYKIDTTLMFRDAVHAAVLETVDGITEAKGIRALSEDERKPVLRDLFTPTSGPAPGTGPPRPRGTPPPPPSRPGPPPSGPA